MKPRERFLKAINMEETDRPPVYCSIVPQIAEKLCDYYNVPFTPGIDSTVGSRISWQDLMLRLGADCFGVAGCAPDTFPTYKREDGVMINEWGIGMKNHGLYDDFEIHPLAHVTTVEEIEAYPFPDINAPGRFRHAEEMIAKYGKDYGIIGDLETAIFETAWYMVGLEKLFMDMAMEEPYVDVLFDKIANFHTEVGKQLIRLGVDVLWAGDDFGSQNGLLLSTDMWDRYFRPRMEKMFKEFKSVNPNVKIAWHTCGAVGKLIPSFIEIGLDILNPIQPKAAGMDPQALKDTYGDKLMFMGGICVQELLPLGTPEQIKAEVKRRCAILSKGGGYIAAPAHNIQADTSLENIFAMFEGVKEFGEEKAQGKYN